VKNLLEILVGEECLRSDDFLSALFAIDLNLSQNHQDKTDQFHLICKDPHLVRPIGCNELLPPVDIGKALVDAL
jgi:hypothetical protein